MRNGLKNAATMGGRDAFRPHRNRGDVRCPILIAWPKLSLDGPVSPPGSGSIAATMFRVCLAAMAHCFATQILPCAGAFESVLGGAHDNKGALAPIEDQF
ncbi:hypothetical protein ACFPTO_18265 [Paraburkholderia denitrificans]|uniref:Uncharacterized protein n=1 Tax=Paraburkholderia denitrificans TaxID=694025 RepID=A0ABW0JC43_9BURK